MYCNWLCLCPFNTEHFESLQCYSFVFFLLGTSLYKSVSVNLEAFSYTVKLTLEEGWDLADAPDDAPDDGWSGNKSLNADSLKVTIIQEPAKAVSYTEDRLNVPVTNLHILIRTCNAIVGK